MINAEYISDFIKDITTHIIRDELLYALQHCFVDPPGLTLSIKIRYYPGTLKKT